MNVPLTASTDGHHRVCEQLNTSRLNGPSDSQSFLRIPQMAISHTRFIKALQSCEIQCLRRRQTPASHAAVAPRSVIILDNARIHRNREFQDLCTDAGVRAEYLPPYTPDFLDNARIHRNREFQDLCTDAGVRAEYPHRMLSL